MSGNAIRHFEVSAQARFEADGLAGHCWCKRDGLGVRPARPQLKPCPFGGAPDPALLSRLRPLPTTSPTLPGQPPRSPPLTSLLDWMTPRKLGPLLAFTALALALLLRGDLPGLLSISLSS